MTSFHRVGACTELQAQGSGGRRLRTHLPQPSRLGFRLQSPQQRGLVSREEGRRPVLETTVRFLNSEDLKGGWESMDTWG